MILRSTDIKQGATLSLGGYVNLPTGLWSIASDVRDGNGVLIQALTATITDPVIPSDQFSVLLTATPEQTAIWPLGTLYCDVRFTQDSGLELISPTFNIVVLEAQTYA